MIITIDGPAGSGKSTAARLLAERLGVAYLDTGAMYRAVALAALERGTALNDPDAVADLADRCDLHVEPGPTGCRVLLDDRDVTGAIRSKQVNEATGLVARVPAIRRTLVAAQRRIGQRLGSLVAEGRDQGAVVFPQADYKFLLDADLDIRAQRRLEEMVADGQDVSLEQVRCNLADRDARDERQWAPLLESGQAVSIDTTHMSLEQVVDVLARRVVGERVDSE